LSIGNFIGDGEKKRVIGLRDEKEDCRKVHSEERQERAGKRTGDDHRTPTKISRPPHFTKRIKGIHKGLWKKKIDQKGREKT